MIEHGHFRGNLLHVHSGRKIPGKLPQSHDKWSIVVARSNIELGHYESIMLHWACYFFLSREHSSWLETWAQPHSPQPLRLLSSEWLTLSDWSGVWYHYREPETTLLAVLKNSSTSSASTAWSVCTVNEWARPSPGTGIGCPRDVCDAV